MSAQKPQKTQFSPNNPLEVGRDMLKSATNQATNLGTEIFQESLTQVGAMPRRKLHGEIDVKQKTNQVFEQEVSLSEFEVSKDHKKVELVQKQFHMVRTQEKVVFDLKTQKVESEIAQLHRMLEVEVKKLNVQATGLSDDIRKITVENVPGKKAAGIYYVNFFQWLVKSVRDLTRKVSQSRLWLQASYHKKAKKGYWAMAKKHGSTFTMSSERASADAG